MIEAFMIWNEPNNLSHWDFELDPDWTRFAALARAAGAAIGSESRALRVMGGISPIDPRFVQRLTDLNAFEYIDVVAVHGFPLDWNHWQIQEWPQRLDDVRAVSRLPLWVTEVGASSFGAEEVQEFGLVQSAELLLPRSDRVFWYSLLDLPRAWPATTRHREAEGSSYYRHFYMGLVREDGSAKRAFKRFSDYAPKLGVCQWFHFEDPRLDGAVRLLRELGVKRLRTGLSWADSLRPGAERWFDRQMKALDDFDLTVTYCFTPESAGIRPHHTSPARDENEFADFCARMTRRYA